MKKSKVKIEEFLKDVNNVLDLVSKVDSLDPEKTDKIIKEKYKDLDTEK